MNMEEGNNLNEKYLEGATSLTEEELLFNKSNNTDPGISSWSKYVKQNKKRIPQDFNNELWNVEMFKTKKKPSKYVYLIAIVLIISLLGLLATHFTKPKDLDYETKRILLNEAIAMTAPQTQIPQGKQIIYEDDLLIIYIPQP
ncbi:MAG: hypothetical protein ACI9FN_001712 [Saprospiraceae bacterium]|jgi:hypothetical protein